MADRTQAAKMVTQLTDSGSKALVAKRPAHPLNDKAVGLRAGAESKAVFAGGASLTGGYGHVGYVWAVMGDRAMVDFGTDSSGSALRVTCLVADIEAK